MHVSSHAVRLDSGTCVFHALDNLEPSRLFSTGQLINETPADAVYEHARPRVAART
ncbi:MAG TPA: hypothetical protein VMS64_14255 [Candidatus Methylomirabilis sp.]|nr:hypothetical protein [Candidatus Methylomirabilis sp.]